MSDSLGRIHANDSSQGRRSNLEHLQASPGFEFVQGDVRDERLVDQLVSGCDCVVHLAAAKIPRYGNALETLMINAEGASSVLQSASRHRAKVVLASTSDIYGRNPDPPFHEESNCWIGPSTVRRWSYAVSKLYDERLGFAYYRETGLPVVAARFFGGYGPRQNLSWRGGPQSVFIDAALRDVPMEIHGDGRQTRSFTYVSDHVDGIVRCIESDAADGQAFNLGALREISILDLATLIWRLAGEGDPKLEMVPYETFGKYEDVRRRTPDTSKAKRLLGFQDRVGLEEGLRRTIERQRAVSVPAA